MLLAMLTLTLTFYCVFVSLRVCFGGFTQSAAAFLMSFLPGSGDITIITDKNEDGEVKSYQLLLRKLYGYMALSIVLHTTCTRGYIVKA